MSAFLSSSGAPQARDVPQIEYDLPSTVRPWDTSIVEMEKRLDETGRRAFVRLKDSTIQRSTQATVVRADETDSSRLVRKGVLAAISARSADRALVALEQFGVRVLQYYDRMGMALVEVPLGAAARLVGSSFVDFLDPESIARPHTVPFGGIRPKSAEANAAAFFAQTNPWGIDTIKAPLGWQYSVGSGAKLLVMDQGHFQGHVDLPLVPTGNCLGQWNGCDDFYPNSHGTHVLGIAAALNNGIGVVGVAPGIGATNIWVWGACNEIGCHYADIVAGLNWAAGNLTPRGVINMSFGGPDGPGEATAVAAALAADIVLVASAGNNGNNVYQYPAGYTNVVGVAGMKQDKTFPLNDNAPCSNVGDPQPGSNWGQSIDLVGPWDARSTIANNEYAGPEAAWCGTSMAAPHVAGLAALVRAYYPTAGRWFVWDRLRSTALDLGTYSLDNYFGWGMARHLAVGFNVPVITATIVGGKPRLTWPAVPHATRYEIWRWVTPNAPYAVLWATVTGTTYTDNSTQVTSFYGYNMFPNPSTISVSYQVAAVAENLNWAGAYATYIANGTPPY